MEVQAESMEMQEEHVINMSSLFSAILLLQ